MFIYYVYAYLRENGTPYYIGKGKGNRAWGRHQKHIPVPKEKSRIIILYSNLSESEAFDLEIKNIKFYGRKNNNTGILINRTDGGEGSSGLVLSEESKRKISESTKGRTAHNKGKPNPSQKEKMLQNNPMKNPEIAKKVSEKLKNRFTWNKDLQTGIEPHNKIKDTFIWHCKQCGKEHIDRDTVKNRKAANFCNKSCAASYSNSRRYKKH